ncbi:hypothetical protein PHYC_02462 [Phycisphaerales bacterium]|nr:hypothetical protein PHYC_02462 [Phycisphaerales bacterium]
MSEFDPEAYCFNCGYPAPGGRWRCPECGERNGEEPACDPRLDAAAERTLVLVFTVYGLAYLGIVGAVASAGL